MTELPLLLTPPPLPTNHLLPYGLPLLDHLAGSHFVPPPSPPSRFCTMGLIIFLCLFTLQQGSLSSEAELSQYFSHDITNQTSLSETTVMGSSDDDMLHHRSCSTSLDESGVQPLGRKQTNKRTNTSALGKTLKQIFSWTLHKADMY